jgi:glucosamine--fructose-6-phosphate aminotransferase (isomerizing)
MGALSLGSIFEREIHDQPDVWDGVAESDRAQRLAAAIDGDVLFVGSGSSLAAGQLGAVALRRRGIRAQALAATEARLDRNAYADCVVIALSQSGRSTDLLDALDALAPRRLVALTNTVDSPLGQRADVTIDIGAGEERAVPASKSVTATAAIVLWAASLAGGDHRRSGAMLHATAATVRAWLADGARAEMQHAGATLARTSNVVVLKLKEARYVHAEGFAAGEFRHGSIATVDATYAAIAVVDDVSFETVARPMRELAPSGALRYSIGGTRIPEVEALGPSVDEPFNTLAWLVTAQLLALYTGRARGIDSDTPRGLTKALIGPGG